MDVIQYNAMLKFVRVLDNLQCLAKEKKTFSMKRFTILVYYDNLMAKYIITVYVHVPSRIVFMPKCRNVVIVF